MKPIYNITSTSRSWKSSLIITLLLHIHHKPCFKASSRNVKLSAKEPWNTRKHKRWLCTLVKNWDNWKSNNMKFLNNTFKEWIAHLNGILHITKRQWNQQIQGIWGTWKFSFSCFVFTLTCLLALPVISYDVSTFCKNKIFYGGFLFEKMSLSPFQIYRVNTRRNLI